MPTVSDRAEHRSDLARYDDLLEIWIKHLHDQAEHVNGEQLESLIATAKSLAQRLSANLPPTLDPSAVAELRGILLDGYQWLDESDSEPREPLDILNDFMVRSEAIRHIVRDALDEDIGPGPHTTSAAMARIDEMTDRAWSNGDLADLLDVDVRTIMRWRKGEGQAGHELLLLVRLVKLLRMSWTPAGVLAWFNRTLDVLGGLTPKAALRDAKHENELVSIARQGRAQHGA